MASILLAALGGVFFLVGLASLLGATKRIVMSRRLKASAVQPVGSVDEGPVEIEGTVRALDETLTAPVSKTDCVAYEVDVQEFSTGGDSGRWLSQYSDTGNVPFAVADDTGRVRVEPAETTRYTLEPSVYHRLEGTDSGALRVGPPGYRQFDQTDRPSEYVEAFLDEAGVDHDPASDGEKLVVEQRVTPGDSVYVAGVLEKQTEGGGVVRAVHATPVGRLFGFPFVLGDDEATVEADVSGGTTVALLVAGLLGTVMGGGVVASAL